MTGHSSQTFPRLWNEETNLFQVVEAHLDGLRSVREVSNEEIRRIQNSIAKLHGLLSFPFTALQLSADIDEEKVADIFVRINSQGKTLNQADFILTLMSVFWDEGRTDLEDFCRQARDPIHRRTIVIQPLHRTVSRPVAAC